MSYLYPPVPSFPSDVKLTNDGGIARLMYNRTGAATVKGQVVYPDSANDNSVLLTPTGTYDSIGVFLDDGVPNGSLAWVVYTGVAYIRFEDNMGIGAEDWVGVSDAEVGYAQAIAVPSGNTALHFRELGHALETVAAPGVGNHALALCQLHFN